MSQPGSEEFVRTSALSIRSLYFGILLPAPTSTPADGRPNTILISVVACAHRARTQTRSQHFVAGIVAFARLNGHAPLCDAHLDPTVAAFPALRRVAEVVLAPQL